MRKRWHRWFGHPSWEPQELEFVKDNAALVWHMACSCGEAREVLIATMERETEFFPKTVRYV